MKYFVRTGSLQAQACIECLFPLFPGQSHPREGGKPRSFLRWDCKFLYICRSVKKSLLYGLGQFICVLFCRFDQCMECFWVAPFSSSLLCVLLHRGGPPWFVYSYTMHTIAMEASIATDHEAFTKSEAKSAVGSIFLVGRVSTYFLRTKLLLQHQHTSQPKATSTCRAATRPETRPLKIARHSRISHHENIRAHMRDLVLSVLLPRDALCSEDLIHSDRSVLAAS